MKKSTRFNKKKFYLGKLEIENLHQTQKLAFNLYNFWRWWLKKNWVVVFLSGPFGVGKTTFTQFVAKASGIKNNLRSPSFIIWQSYSTKNLTLHHLDLYRVKFKEYFFDYLKNFLTKKNLILIEWGEKFFDFIPYFFLLKFSYLGPHKRLVKIYLCY